jgi:hypothetical protein
LLRDSIETGIRCTDNGTVTVASPRLDRRLRRAARKLDDPAEPIAETWRKVGRRAEELGLPRPGYDTIRLLVGEHRRRRALQRALLDPVVSDLLQGRLSTWDVEQLLEARRLSRLD